MVCGLNLQSLWSSMAAMFLAAVTSIKYTQDCICLIFLFLCLQKHSPGCGFYVNQFPPPPERLVCLHHIQGDVSCCDKHTGRIWELPYHYLLAQKDTPRYGKRKSSLPFRSPFLRKAIGTSCRGCVLSCLVSASQGRWSFSHRANKRQIL